ncbi:hypothetical protein CLIB1444_02S01750 [[Candida] jaroonii]|uniref:Uncharacterized protein n=1 Tax=[Candida] jaroonii TaxID=467808 RepID=A0ACA9Y2E3_9ASCO|nr:hypothetical protein CLIB1444_02S01750 [[Candida] jaroonii]
MSVRFDEFKGFVIDPNVKALKPQETTTGINKLPVYEILNFKPVESEENEESEVKEKKKSKSQRKIERQQKKIRISQRKLQQRLMEDQKFEPDYTPIQITNEIKKIYLSLSTKTETKLLQYQSVSLYSTDLSQILPGEWINDNIISLVHEFLSMNYINSNSLYKKSIKLLPPTVVQLLLFTDFNDVLDVKDIESAKFIFLPANESEEGDHWVLGVLDLLRNKFFIYDSMMSETYQIFDNLLDKFKKLNIVTGKIEIIRVKIEQQSNFDDCGVFLIMISCYLINMLLNEDINFDLSSLKFNPVKARLDIFKLIRFLITQDESAS